jgi:hypothetical protein
MTSPQSILGVLDNFLGTYTSRHSDYRGYWLFGFLVNNFDELRMDLLSPVVNQSDDPEQAATALAAAKFADQLAKAGLTRSQVRDAWLTIRRIPDLVTRVVSGRPRLGHNVSFAAEATAAGKQYRRERVVFVAAHDPRLELPSTRACTTFGKRMSGGS